MLAAASYMIAFRIVHILAAIAWAGSAFLFVVFVQPSVAAIAPAGAPSMAELLGKRRLADVLISLGSVTVVGGLFLYWHDWHTFDSFSAWISSNFGATLTVGAVLALVALGFGIFGTWPNVKRLLAMGRQVAQGGGPPSPELAAQIAETQRLLKLFARTSLSLIALSALAMATARYL